MRHLFLILLGSCNEAKAPALDPNTLAFDVEVFRWANPPSQCATTEKAVMDAPMLELRRKFDECWATASIDGSADGKLLLQVYAGPSGEPCAIRTKARMGFSPGFVKCVENAARETHMNASGYYEIPIAYGENTVDMRALSTCARLLSAPADATIAFASDENGKVEDVRIDPFHGDQDSLGCVAEELARGEHPASKHFIANVRMVP